MLRTIFTAVTRTFYFVQRYAPGPRLITRIRRRDGLKCGIPAMLVAAPYYLIAALCQHLIEGGATMWLSAPMLWCLVMGTTFILLGPVSVVLLVIARIREALAASEAPGMP